MDPPNANDVSLDKYIINIIYNYNNNRNHMSATLVGFQFYLFHQCYDLSTAAGSPSSTLPSEWQRKTLVTMSQFIQRLEPAIFTGTSSTRIWMEDLKLTKSDRLPPKKPGGKYRLETQSSSKI